MQAVVKAVFKDKQYVEQREILISKKVQTIEEHYNIIVDEVSDSRINQQTLLAKASNKELIEKLENLTMYQQVKLVVNVNFYEGKPSKIVVLDILEDDNELKTMEQIFKRVDQQQQEQQEARQKKEQE